MYNDNTFDNLFTGRESGGVYYAPTASQNLAIVFSGFYLSAMDGDFTTDPVTITSETGESEDITIGNAPAKVLTATMLNPDGLMDSLTWGDGSVYIGCVTQTDSLTLDSGRTMGCALGADTYQAGGNRFVVKPYGGTTRTKTTTGDPCCIVVDSMTGYADCYTTTYMYSYRGGSITENALPTGFMANKYLTADGTCFVLGTIGVPGGVWKLSPTDSTKMLCEAYSYVPMGVFDFSNVDAFGITFGVEAYDKMTVFDADYTNTWNAIDFSGGIQLQTLAGTVVTDFGFSSPTISASAVNKTVTWSTNPITSYAVTGRDILKWLAEAMCCNVRMTRTGGVEFYTFSSTPVATITPNTIISNTRVKSKATVPAITEVICYSVLGAGYQEGVSGTPYYIVGNPFIDPSGGGSELSDFLALIDDIPAYYALTISNACADPRLDAGDFVTITDIDNNTITIPLMHQSLSWNGTCVTYLAATGKQVRDIPEGMNNTDLSSMVDSNPSAVVNKIQAVGIDADWITAGIISDRQGNNRWDLDSGVITIENGALNTVYTLTYEAANYDQSDLDTVDDYLNGVITSLTTEEWEKYDFLGTRHLTTWNRNHIAQMIATGTDAIKTVTTNIDPHSSDNSVYSSIKVSAVGTSPQYTINGSLSAARLGATTTRSSYVDVFNGVTVHSDSYSGGRYNTYVQQNYIGLTDSMTTNSVTIRTDKLSATDGTNTTSMTGANATVTDGTNTTTQAATGITLTDGVDTSVLTAGIGKRVHSDSSVSLSSGTTMQNLGDFTLTKGLWMVSVTVRFNSNATGRRAMNISNTSGGSAYNVRWGNTSAAVNGAYTYLHLASSIDVTAANATFYINAYQNSGGSLTTAYAWDAVRVY